MANAGKYEGGDHQLNLSHQAAGLVIKAGGANPRDLVIDLQRDLRRLGYLARGINGEFGASTEKAIKALQFDLIHNGGARPWPNMTTASLQ
jgi:peptidoglycan hydrolase-like protein with peptidoglycan-binding domain